MGTGSQHRTRMHVEGVVRYNAVPLVEELYFT